MIKWGSTKVEAVKWGTTNLTCVKWGSTIVFPDGYDGSSFSPPISNGFNTVSKTLSEQYSSGNVNGKYYMAQYSNDSINFANYTQIKIKYRITNDGSNNAYFNIYLHTETTLSVGSNALGSMSTNFDGADVTNEDTVSISSTKNTKLYIFYRWNTKNTFNKTFNLGFYLLYLNFI